MPKQRSRPEFRTAFNTYAVVEQRGQGGAGIVYVVNDIENIRYALKALNSAAGTVKTKRFKNEIAFCSKNTHKNVVTVLDHGIVETDGKDPLLFYVMPLYPRSLRELITAGVARDDVLPLFAQVLDGVEAAHKLGVCHRDLKPENILVDLGKL